MASYGISRLRTRLQRLARHGRWTLVPEAALSLAFARAAVLVRPFNRIAPSLTKQLAAASTTPTQSAQRKAEQHRASQIGWVVRTVGKRTPWKSNCLAQAIAAKRMLQRRQIASTLFLGVAKEAAQQPSTAPEPTAELTAHAWLMCGGDVLTGKREHERFTVVGEFRDQVTSGQGRLDHGPTSTPSGDQQL